MTRFHIKGYAGRGNSYWSSMPVDVVVFAEDLPSAKIKAEGIVGHYISDNHFRYEAEEILPQQLKEGE